jgi:hypothetical protein
MATYYITIAPIPISYEIEADSEEQAKSYALDFFADETIHDIVKNAEIVSEEMTA